MTCWIVGQGRRSGLLDRGTPVGQGCEHVLVVALCLPALASQARSQGKRFFLNISFYRTADASHR
jgi:hypothetical protein